MNFSARNPLRRSLLLALVAALHFAPANVHAALSNPPHEDIHFLAEHVPEAAEDARAFLLAWPTRAFEPGRWETAFSAGWAEAEADFLNVRGTLISASGIYARSERSGVSILGFYDSFSIGGSTGEQVLRPSFASGAPLDTPERAEFSNPRGEVRHYGFAGAWLNDRVNGELGRTWQVGLWINRLEVDGYQLDYRLLGGANAGARGVLDHSSRATFVTPYVGIGWRRPLGTNWAILPRLMAGAPLPSGDFEGRISGPGFDRSSRDAGGKPGEIGDGFVTASAGLLHRPTGIEFDLGAAIAYPLFEKYTHDGVNQSLLLSVSWHPRKGDH